MDRCVICGKERAPGSDRCQACSAAAAPPARASQPTVVDARQLIGKVINGKYHVLSILGEGGMGVVYKVRHLILQNKSTFALKILHPTLCSQSDFRARFLREVEIAMELTHENIVQIRDFGLTEQGLLFYTMDFFAGESLKAVLARSGPLPAQRVLRILGKVLLALAEAHRVGVVHRDLKPDNILIEPGANGVDEVRILDFGIAKIVSGDGEKDEGSLTRGSVIGTPRYMSPEQASGESIDGRSDLYSLGCIVFEMLTGKAPFDGPTTRSILMAHLTAPLPRLATVRPGLELPGGLEPLVERMLAKDRGARPASAGAILRLLSGKPEAPTGKRPAPAQRTPVPPVPAPRRRRWWLAAVAATLIAGGGGLGWWWLAGASRPARAERVPADRPVDVPAVPEPERGGPARGKARLRCEVCGATYTQGQRLGDMCHGVPLIEIEQ
jgi:serine/threonine-protein kinase